MLYTDHIRNSPCLPRTSGVTSAQFVWSGIIITLIDASLILLLAWRIKPDRFRALKWWLVGSAAVFWSLFGFVLVRVFWDSYYHYFYPAGFRSGGILLFVPLVYGLLALVYHWLAFRLPGNPILVLCLLAGLESLLEHAWGLFGFKIMEIPMLQEASPLSVLVFAVPEYIFNWCVVIGLAALSHKCWRWLVKLHPDRISK